MLSGRARFGLPVQPAQLAPRDPTNFKRSGNYGRMESLTGSGYRPEFPSPLRFQPLRAFGSYSPFLAARWRLPRRAKRARPLSGNNRQDETPSAFAIRVRSVARGRTRSRRIRERRTGDRPVRADSSCWLRPSRISSIFISTNILTSLATG